MSHSTAKALHGTCINLLKKEKYVDAIAMLSEDMQNRSGLVRPLTLASECCIKLGWYEEAADLAAAGITLDPSADPAWYNAALSLMKLGKPGEARAVLRQAPERVRARAVIPGSGFGKVDGVAFLSFQTQEPSKLVWNGLDSSATVEAMRNLGWQEWKNGNYEASLNWWKSLIHRKANYIGNSLLIRSLSNLEHKQSRKALMDITTATMLDPAHLEKLHMGILSHRQAVLEKMGHHNAAKKMASFAVKQAEQLRQKEFEATYLPRHDMKKPVPGSTTEDEHHENMYRRKKFNEHDYGLVESMLRALPEEMRKKLSDERVMPLHEEFRSGPPLAHCNTEECIRWLQSGYLNSRMASRVFESNLERDDNPNTDTEMIRRLGGDRERNKMWWDEASIGDINTRSPLMKYAPDVYQTFSNVTPKSITLKFGEKHVAVGYVDMGVLLWANIVGDKAAGPLEFVGYEMSAYATSRTHVLAQMLRDGAHVDSILQVGYSSGWSFTCLNEFREAVNKVLEKGELTGFAKNILLHWKDAPNVSLLESQEKWRELHYLDDCFHANVVQKEDRLAVIHYMLCGRLLECDVGSITMFGNPPEIPHVAREEFVYSTLSPEELGENYGSYGSIMGVVVGGLRKRIERLRELMHQGLVRVDLKLRCISAEDLRSIKEIRAMNPTSMSWSNVGDFMPLEHFHNIVRACSSNQTVHHLHSMNWIMDIKGTFLVDYDGAEKRAAIIEQCVDASAKYLRDSIGEGILHIPPIATPNNVSQLVSLRFSERWLNHFVKSAAPNRIKVKDTAVSRFTPLMGNPTFYITFTCCGL